MPQIFIVEQNGQYVQFETPQLRELFFALQLVMTVMHRKSTKILYGLLMTKELVQMHGCGLAAVTDRETRGPLLTLSRAHASDSLPRVSPRHLALKLAYWTNFITETIFTWITADESHCRYISR